MCRWRALPPVYLIAFGAWVVALVVSFVQSFAGWDHRSDRWELVGTGAHFAAGALVVAGSFELSRRLAGRARQALRLASWLSLTFIFASTLVRWIATFARGDHLESIRVIYDVWGYVGTGLAVVAAVAFAVAAWSRRGLAIAGLVLVLLSNVARLMSGKLLVWLGWNVAGGFYRLYSLESLIDLVGMLVLVLAIASAAGAMSPEPARATRGLSRVAGALYWRVIALCIATGLTVLYVVGSPHGAESAEHMVKFGVFSGALVALLSQAWLSIGIIDAASAAVTELAAWPLAIAAALALWCTGVANVQLPELYATLYGKYGSFGGETAQALVTALPLVSTASLAIVAATIGAFATRRALEDLRVHASGKGVAFVVLMLAGIAITAWLIPKAETLSSFVMMSLCMFGAMLAAMVLMARLCKLAAAAVEAQPGLPTAKIVS